MDDQLTTAIARLEEFIGTYPEGDPIDGDMPLTVDDVRRVIDAARVGAQIVSFLRQEMPNIPTL